jgi:hypothetical protein
MYTFGHEVNPSPANSYIFAFKIASRIPISGYDDVIRLSSESNGTSFNPVGGALPSGNIYNEQQHFILKGASTLYNSPMYLGFSMNDSGDMYYDADGSTGNYSEGSTTTVVLHFSGWSMQALSTTVKQW